MSLESLDSATPTVLPAGEKDGVWLDELPEDVCSRIALFIDAKHENVVPLSKVSRAQRSAVKHGLSYKLVKDVHTHDGIADLLRDDTYAIISEGFSESLRVSLKSPRLEELHLHNICKCDLDTLLVAKNLRILDLGFSGNKMPFPFPSGMSHLPIRELNIVSWDVCLHETFTDNPERHELLAKWFPRVETLWLHCARCLRFPPIGELSSYLWRAIEPFSCLRDVTLTEPVPDDAYEKLNRINSVKLRTTIATVAFRHIEMLFDRIDLIQVSLFEMNQVGLAGVDLITRDKLERFNTCANLKHLRCSIQRGTETELVKVTKNLRYLWLGVNDERNAENEEDGEAPPYEPEAGAILNAVKAAPHLTEITLNNMAVRMSEIREILAETRIRLSMFTEDVPERLLSRGSYQYPVEKNREILQELTKTFAAAAIHNRSLKLFFLAPEWHWFSDREAVRESLPRLETALIMLRRRAPLLHTYALDRLYSKLACLGGSHEMCLSEIDTSNESDSDRSESSSSSSGDSHDAPGEDRVSDEGSENEGSL